MYPGAHLTSRPHDPAVIMAEGGETVTFAQLESRSIQMARALADCGLQPGDHLAVLATNTARVFDIYWAAMRSGLYLTMVNWHLTAGESAHIVSDCGATALIVDAALADIGTELIPLTPERDDAVRVLRAHRRSRRTGCCCGAATDRAARRSTAWRGHAVFLRHHRAPPRASNPQLPGRQIHEPGDTMTAMNQSVWGGVGPDTVYLSPRAAVSRSTPPYVRVGPGPRRHRGGDGTIRRGTSTGAHREVPRHLQPVGADDVRPHAAPPRGGARPVRHLEYESRGARRGPVPGRRQTGHDRLVGGAHPLRVLLVHRAQRSHHRRHPGVARTPGNSGGAGRSGHHPRLRRVGRRDAARNDRHHLLRAGPVAFRVSQRPGEDQCRAAPPITRRGPRRETSATSTRRGGASFSPIGTRS